MLFSTSDNGQIVKQMNAICWFHLPPLNTPRICFHNFSDNSLTFSVRKNQGYPLIWKVFFIVSASRLKFFSLISFFVWHKYSEGNTTKSAGWCVHEGTTADFFVWKLLCTFFALEKIHQFTVRHHPPLFKQQVACCWAGLNRIFF